MPANVGTPPPDAWERYLMALDDVTHRLRQITAALRGAGVPYALVGGQAVALWVATRDPAAVRTTKDVDILLRRADVTRAKALRGYFMCQTGLAHTADADDSNDC